jgi:hypothetical protein
MLAVCALSHDKKEISSPNTEVSTDSPVIDVYKYGFVLSRTSENGVVFYKKEIREFVVELMVAANVYSLEYNLNGNTVKVANRYKVKTQEQLDFLILNGRVGWLFTY